MIFIKIYFLCYSKTMQNVTTMSIQIFILVPKTSALTNEPIMSPFSQWMCPLWDLFPMKRPHRVLVLLVLYSQLKGGVNVVPQIACKRDWVVTLVAFLCVLSGIQGLELHHYEPCFLWKGLKPLHVINTHNLKLRQSQRGLTLVYLWRWFVFSSWGCCQCGSQDCLLEIPSSCIGCIFDVEGLAFHFVGGLYLY